MTQGAIELKCGVDIKVRIVLTALLTLIFVLYVGPHTPLPSLLVAVPTFVLLYLWLFSVGAAQTAERLRRWVGESALRVLAVPLLLAAVIYLYVALGGQAPLQGNTWLIPVLFVLPGLYWLLSGAAGGPIDHKVVVGVVVALIPYAYSSFPINTNLPYQGGGFETVYLTLALSVAVYGVVVIGRMREVGFCPAPSLTALRTTLAVWAAYFPLVLVIGLATGLLRPAGHSSLITGGVIATVGAFLHTYLHDGLLEEFVFRGLFQNFAGQWLSERGGALKVLAVGAALLLVVAIAEGVILKGPYAWFPFLAAAVLLPWAWRLCIRDPGSAHRYTAQYIIGVAFGLLHLHIGSTAFIGLAIWAGWAYGEVYRRTENVFYAGLCHAMVNAAPAWFGLIIVR